MVLTFKDLGHAPAATASTGPSWHAALSSCLLCQLQVAHCGPAANELLEARVKGLALGAAAPALVLWSNHAHCAAAQLLFHMDRAPAVGHARGELPRLLRLGTGAQVDCHHAGVEDRLHYLRTGFGHRRLVQSCRRSPWAPPAAFFAFKARGSGAAATMSGTSVLQSLGSVKKKVGLQ